MFLGNVPLWLPGFQLTKIRKHDDRIEIEATSVQNEASCPNCKTPSRRVHSYYARVPSDLPIFDARVRLRLTVKRLRCEREDCPKATFVESFPEFLVKYARRTSRLVSTQRKIAFALGGCPGSRLAKKLRMPVSRDTLLRMIRDTPVESQTAPEVIGVDDWAKRRGRVYGTMIVDLERRKVIDLLEDRKAETLEDWLKSNSSVKIVARDRSTEYARGISNGAPQAMQVADRWHLLVNLKEALERLLDRLRPELNTLSSALAPEDPDEIPILRTSRRSKTDELAKRERLNRRQELHAEIHRLYKAGHAIRAITRQLGKSRNTIYKYLAMKEFPAKFARKQTPKLMDPYVPHLRRRWKEGCRNASELWREIQALGYPGTRKPVAQWVYERREQPGAWAPRKEDNSDDLKKGDPVNTPSPTSKSGLPVARRLVWLFVKPIDKLTPEESQLRSCLIDHETLARAVELGQNFQEMIKERKAQEFGTWLESCETSKIPELKNLALGMRKDFSAIQNALISPWSNGQTEGQINRLKLLKRQMYGRANFDLLRLRCLHPP